MKTLLDHNLGRHRIFLYSSMKKDGWLDLIDVPMLTFADIGMSRETSDREIWHYAQKHQLILLTANRNGKDKDSLTQTIRDENSPTSLPVLTVGDADRILEDSIYCQRCMEKIIDVVMNIENYLGAGRIYIP